MPSAPYDNLESVLQAARVRLNDAIQSISGEIVTDISAFTPGAVNSAWRRVQEYLAARGFAALNRERIFTSVPAWTSTDLGTFVYFDWVSYFDGTNPQSAPVLPQDMISPLDLYERVHSVGGNYTPIDQCFNGLPTVARDSINRLWEWRQEKIYLPGATGITDIRMRYAGYIGDFNIGIQDQLNGIMTNVTTTMILVTGLNVGGAYVGNGSYVLVDSEIMLVTAGGGSTAQTVARAQMGTSAAAHATGANVTVLAWGIPVTIMRSLNSFAWFVCSEIAHSRGDLDAGWFDQQAMQAAEYIWNRDFRQGKSLYKRAELGKVTDNASATDGPLGPRGGKA